MKNQKRFIWCKLSLVVVLIALAMSAAPVFADVSNREGPPPVQAAPSDGLRGAQVQNAMMIPIGAFAPDSGGSGEYYKSFFSGDLYATTDTTDLCFLAPVVFPSGAKKIKKVYVYVKDQNASKDTTFYFVRTNPATGDAATLGSVITSDSTGITEYEIPVSDPALSNNYTYHINVCLPIDILVYGAKVTYKPAL